MQEKKKERKKKKKENNTLLCKSVLTKVYMLPRVYTCLTEKITKKNSKGKESIHLTT